MGRYGNLRRHHRRKLLRVPRSALRDVASRQVLGLCREGDDRHVISSPPSPLPASLPETILLNSFLPCLSTPLDKLCNIFPFLRRGLRGGAGNSRSIWTMLRRLPETALLPCGASSSRSLPSLPPSPCCRPSVRPFLPPPRTLFSRFPSCLHHLSLAPNSASIYLCLSVSLAPILAPFSSLLAPPSINAQPPRAQGPPIFLFDAHGLPLPEGDTHISEVCGGEFKCIAPAWQYGLYCGCLACPRFHRRTCCAFTVRIAALREVRLLLGVVL